ncbi:hypothetical protein [Saccharopolyspora phatthalungensis]|uniref:Uncharacterized protein n=1 Tax=Saccharopolyspora phatthalungensis TaxID=664693 RepID=A0A840QHQ9_9PSEU|nr:hypothetical protein [Saccharopolyspora phatthalungensis]MBB5158328.1 hypothetical protein [Saccharopolyspora phatthalungensis]
MPAEHPDQLRRWWWKTPLAVRLLPAAALLIATGTGVLSALPAGGQDLAALPQPPQAPIGYLAQTTTAPAPATPTTTTEPEPATPTTTPTNTTTTSTTTPRPTTSTTTTTPPQQPQPTHPDIPPGQDGNNGRPHPTTATTTDEQESAPTVTEGQRCSHQGDVGSTASGAPASCQRSGDGKLRWTTQ